MRKLSRAIVLASSLGMLACAGSAPPPPTSPAPAAQKCTGAAEPTKPEAPAASVAPSAPAVPVKTPEEALTRLFTAAKVDADWFTPAFVAQVPPSKIESIMKDTKDEVGTFTKIEKEGDRFTVVMSKGKLPVRIAIDGEGRITTLWFSPPELTAVPPLDEVVAGLRALPAKVSYLVLTDGADVAAHDADVPMAVGSAFKLAILDAVRERIDAKKAQWSDVVRLDAKNKSLPSGSLHTWPNKAPLTLHTLASLMMSVSDNTATDVLLDYVGRDAVEKRAPGNTPFMSTRDAFVLKQTRGAPLLARWRAADSTARRKMLPELAAAKLEDGDFTGEPTVDVEWMFSARKLCELIGRNKALDVVQIEPGIATKKNWDLVAYKGGSEPGVLNYTTWVEKAGKKHCVVTTWNDPAKAVDSAKLASLHGALLASVRDRR
jgi:beta-lactamase class A